MKYFIYIIVIMSLLVTLNSCTADELETPDPKVEVEVDPTPGGTIPPKKNTTQSSNTSRYIQPN